MHDPTVSFSADLERQVLVRSVRDGAGRDHRTEMSLLPTCYDPSDLHGSFDASWLRRPASPWSTGSRNLLRTADIFSGCGGLSLGVCDAAWSLGFDHEVVLAVDTNSLALKVFEDNFHPRIARAESVEALFDGNVGDRLTASERDLRAMTGKVDMLTGGPPCQGNSDLNNHTRRTDPKNDLYLKMARCAEVLEPDHVLIENVMGVMHDKGRVVEKTTTRLRQLGYAVSAGILKAVVVGVPQMRRRHFLVGSRVSTLDFQTISSASSCRERPLSWAIEDLLDESGQTSFQTSARHHGVNVARIDYLFDHDLHDLPDSQRPDCHRLAPHAYQAVYGRMRWDAPAPTITSGFGSTGQGRFVHPLRRRTLTPHEAARVQFFPDFFRFGHLGRRALQQLIGNAVPCKLAFVLALELLRTTPHA